MTTRLLPSARPLVAAPMAGGGTTVALALAVAEAGAFPFLAGGYKSAAALAAEIDELRTAGIAFGVNLFVPAARPDIDRHDYAAYAESLRGELESRGLEVDASPREDDDAWDAKLALLLEHPVPVVSLTFALPPAQQIAALQGVGTRVLATVTTVPEALTAVRRGADGLVVQGPGAGGHSATLDPRRDVEDGDAAALVAAVRAGTDLPLVAAGGVDGPDAVRALLEAGAEAVAVGTLLLVADEAGTSATHRAALADPAFTETVITRAFTGRPARALRNDFVDRHGPEEISAYPAVHHLTRALRQDAARRGDPQALHLWAGTGWRSAEPGPAAEIIRHLDPGQQ